MALRVRLISRHDDGLIRGALCFETSHARTRYPKGTSGGETQYSSEISYQTKLSGLVVSSGQTWASERSIKYSGRPRRLKEYALALNSQKTNLPAERPIIYYWVFMILYLYTILVIKDTISICTAALYPCFLHDHWFRERQRSYRIRSGETYSICARTSVLLCGKLCLVDSKYDWIG